MIFNDIVSNTRISTKIYGGFLVVLCLVVALGLTGFLSLSAATDRSSDQARVGDVARQVQVINATILQMRLHATRYIYGGLTDAVALVRDRGGSAVTLLDNLKADLQSAEQQQDVARWRIC